MTPKCDHCRRQMAFGIFELTLAATQTKLQKNLCADCGFNITNYRTMKLYHFERVYEPPTGGRRTMQQEVMSFKAKYSRCDLIETYTGTLALAKLDQEHRAELAQAESSARAEHRLRARDHPPRPSTAPTTVLVASVGSPRSRQIPVSSSDGVSAPQGQACTPSGPRPPTARAVESRV